MAAWSTAQLIAFQEAIAGFTDEHGALKKAIERIAETLDAEVGAIAAASTVEISIGFPQGGVPESELLAALDGRSRELSVAGAGVCHVALADVPGDPARRLLLARAIEPFDAEEQALIRSMSRMLSVTLRLVRLIERERALHEERERQLAENALLQRFRSAFEDVDIGMAIVGADGCFSRVNRKFAAMLGAGPTELVGAVYHELLDPEDREESTRAFAELASAEASSLVREQRFRHADGHSCWLEVTVSRAFVDDCRALHFVMQAQDVTQRKEAEQALRESEDRYRLLVEHLPLIVYRNALDTPGTDLYVSPEIESLLGYPMSAWQDGTDFFAQVVHPDDRASVYQQLAGVLDTSDDLTVEYRAIARDGRTLTLRQAGTVLRDDRGRPLCVQGYVVDVSEQRRLELQLRLSQKLEAIGQLAAGIAHEINTPIQFVGDSLRFTTDAVGDLVELIDVYRAAVSETAAAVALREAEERADLDYLRERLPAALDRMDDGLDRVAAIVGAMKQMAHPHGDAHARVDINATLQSTLVVTHAQYKYVADVETDLGSVPPVLGDGGELNQVFVNLIVNAAHAISDSGRHGTIRVTTRRDADEAVIAIADTGCGILDDHLDRIFDPFFTTKDVGRGTGQGLAIARSIITERHRGSIAVQSKPDQGTTFEVRLPIADADDPRPAAAG